MPDTFTHADALRVHHTGAASHDAAQATPNSSLGKYRASSEVAGLAASIASPIANLSVDYVAPANGTGSGTLEATGSDTVRWTPPGGSAGTAVTILNGETKVLEGGGSAYQKYVRVTRSSASALSGTATLTLSDNYNNAPGFDNVSSAEASAGDTEYRALALVNKAASEVQSLKVYVGQIGTARVSASAQLGGSGSGTIGISSGNFNDWPDAGWCRIEQSGGTLREIVYYSSRTSTVLTVPAAGRGLLGTSAGAGASDDNLYSVPGIRIAKEAPSGSATTGAITDKTGAGEGSQPAGLTWSTGISASGGVSIGTLAAGEWHGLWIERAIPAGAVALSSVLHLICMDFDAP